MLSCTEPTDYNDFERTRTEQQTEQQIEQQAENEIIVEPQTENNNPAEQPTQQTQPAEEFNYLLPIKNPNLNSYIYMTNVINQGEWENENEKFEFYEGWSFKYWKNKNEVSPTYQGSVKTYQTPYYETETKYFFHGTQNGTIVIWCETTIDVNGTGSIIIGGKTFSKIIIEEPEPVEEYNYLLPNPNYKLSDYDYINSFETDLEGAWQNETGEIFVFDKNSKSVKYYDGVNNIYQWITPLQLSQPTFQTLVSQYREKDSQSQWLFISGNGATTLFFTPFIFENGDLYLGGVQFVKIVIEPEEYNYLMPDENFNLSDYNFYTNSTTELTRYWVNKNGEVFSFASNGTFEYWDNVNNIYGTQPSGAVNKSTMKGTTKIYKLKEDSKRLFLLCEVENTPVVFVELIFKFVNNSINAYNYDWYIGKTQFVNRRASFSPVFID